jgi:hypothetical protein
MEKIDLNSYENEGKAMILAETQTKPVDSVPRNEKVSCPLCGGKMHKSDPARDTVKNASFVWYECDQRFCSGWLVKTTEWF